MRETDLAGRGSFPWFTIVATGLAVVVFFIPTLAEALVYDRDLVLHGDWWRPWTGHWVHFGSSHLLWNLAVFLPAGIWAERSRAAGTRWLLAVSPGVIGLALLAFVPGLARYGGLSGLAAGLLTWLALIRRQAPGADRWFWNAVLGLIGLKIVGELISGNALLADLGEAAARPVPAAHLAGIVCAGVAYFLPRWRQK